MGGRLSPVSAYACLSALHATTFNVGPPSLTATPHARPACEDRLRRDSLGRPRGALALHHLRRQPALRTSRGRIHGSRGQQPWGHTPPQQLAVGACTCTCAPPIHRMCMRFAVANCMLLPQLLRTHVLPPHRVHGSHGAALGRVLQDAGQVEVLQWWVQDGLNRVARGGHRLQDSGNMHA